MNKMKKLLAILVAFVMCFTVFGMVASADVQSTKVYLKLNYADNAATSVNANISTSQACGAIQGTITFSGATFDSAKFIEGGAEADKFVATDNEIKFVIVTDDLDNGDTNWANFKFNITGDATFTLKDVSVCDVGATNIKDGIALDPQNIKVDTTIRTLGGQYRAPADAKEAAIRFGADLKRNEADSTIKEGKAVSCGYVIGFDFNITYKNEGTKDALTSYVSLDGNKLVAKENSGVFVKESKYYFSKTAEDLIYTYAIKGFYNGSNALTYELGGTTYTLAKEKISAVPYVVYMNAAGEYGVVYGDEISRSYDEVVENYNLAN